MNVIKASFYKEKIFSARWFQTWGTLLLGSMVIATGYTFFMTPYQIVPGGIYGISTILNWKLGFPIGMAALCFNLPLSLIGFKILGKDFGFRTFYLFLVGGFVCRWFSLDVGACLWIYCRVGS